MWRIRGSGYVLYADGFWWAARPVPGTVVELLSLQRHNSFLVHGGSPPTVSARRLRLGFWRFLPLGTTYSGAVGLLRRHGLRPSVEKCRVVVKADGAVRASRKVTYTGWDARLDFRRGRLEAITVTAYGDVDWSVQD